MGNQGEYQIKITSVADLAAVEQARAEYQRLKATLAASGGDTSGIDAQLAKLDAAATSGQAAAVRALAGWQQVKAATAKFGGDTKGIDAEIAKLQATLNGAGGAGGGTMAAGVQALSNALAGLPGGSIFSTLFSGGGVAVGALGAVAGAIGAVKKGLDEYAERQSAVAKLDQQLANAGRLTGEYREQIQALADTFSAVSGIDDTTWLKAIGKIQSKDTTANLAQNAELLKNMAARTGDVEQAATLLSRALSGSFDRLRMYGFQIDEGGTKTEKLKQLMEQAAKGGAGVFEAQLQTLTGQKQRLSTATNQLWEGVGRLAFQMGLGGGTARRLGDAIEWLTDKLPKADPVLDATTNKTDGFSKALAQATGKSKELGEHSGDGAEGMATTGEAADKLAEKLAKATAAINDHVAATLRMQDADLALQIAQIQARKADVEQRQGGRLTVAQKQAFNQEEIDARGVAAQRKLAVQESGAEQEIEEIQRAQTQPMAQLGAAQAKQAKADTEIVTTIAAAGAVEDEKLKPADQVEALAEQLRAGQATIQGYKRDLAELEQEISSLQGFAADGDVTAGLSIAEAMKGKRAIAEAIKELEAAIAPLATVQQQLEDLARASKDAEAEVLKLQEVVEKGYAREQTARGKLGVLRVEIGTAKTATATQTTQEQTKAAAEQRALEKKALEEAIKLNEAQLKDAVTGSARQREISAVQRQNQARKLAIELFEEVDLQRRAQMIEQAGRDGFKVRNPTGRPVVTPMTREESLANPTVRPVQTVKPTEAAPAPQPVRTPSATRPATPAPGVTPPAPAAPRFATPAEVARSRWEQDNAARNRKHAEEKADNAKWLEKYNAERAAKRAEDDAIDALADQARGYKPNGQPLDAPATPPAPITPPMPAALEGSVPETPAPVVTPAAPAATVTLPTPTAPVVSVPETPTPVVTPTAPAAPVTLPTPTAPVVSVPETPAPVVTPAAPAAAVTLPTPTAPVISVPETPAPVVIPDAPPEPSTPQMPPEIQTRLNRERPDRYPAPPTAPTDKEGGNLPPSLEPAPGETPAAPSAAAVVAPRAAESAVAAGVIAAGMVGEKATATAATALATYDKAQEVITKTEKVLEKVSRLAAAPGTAGEGAAAAGKAAELGSKIAGQVAIGTEAAGAAAKALAVAGAAGKVAGVLKPLAPVGAVIEAVKLATDFSGETGRVEAAANKGMGPAMAEGLFSPLTSVATAIKLAAEVLALNAENARTGKQADAGAERLAPLPAPLVNAREGAPAQGGGNLPPSLPPGGESPLPPAVPRAAVPPVSFAPVVSGLDDSAKAMTAGGKAVAEAAKRVNQAAADRNEDILAALEALAERDAAMSARLDALNQRMQYGPS